MEGAIRGQEVWPALWNDVKRERERLSDRKTQYCVQGTVRAVFRGRNCYRWNIILINIFSFVCNALKIGTVVFRVPSNPMFISPQGAGPLQGAGRHVSTINESNGTMAFQVALPCFLHRPHDSCLDCSRSASLEYKRVSLSGIWNHNDAVALEETMQGLLWHSNRASGPPRPDEYTRRREPNPIKTL